VLDDNSEAVHSMQLERNSPLHRREVLRLTAATRSALASNRKQRQLLAARQRRDLRSHRETIRTVLMMMRRKWKGSSDEKRGVGTARQQEGAHAGAEFLDVPYAWPQLSDRLGNDCDLPEERKILEAIQRHPEGVSIVEIGNELGVDFRRLLGSTDTLLASGEIDQVQELFYPAGR
jgi:hypothetical protein